MTLYFCFLCLFREGGLFFGRKAISSSDDSRLSSKKNVVLPQFITWLVVVVAKGGGGAKYNDAKLQTHFQKKTKSRRIVRLASGGMTL